MTSRKSWLEDEDLALSELVAKEQVKNWADIAASMNNVYGFKGRSGKQCRERWHNHLNPNISKKSWSKSEEDLMFEQHKIHGNKWTQIAQQLTGRTDNAIKNYFYSTIRRSLRRMSKLVGLKNSTEEMKYIKPSTLSKIFAASIQLSEQIQSTNEEKQLRKFLVQNCTSVRDEIMQFSNYKPKRKDKIPEEEKNKFDKVLQKMIKLNQIYEKMKIQERRRRAEQEMFQKDYKRIMLSDDQSDSEENSENQHSGENIRNSKISPPVTTSTVTTSTVRASDVRASARTRKEINPPKNMISIEQLANSIQFRSKNNGEMQREYQEEENEKIKLNGSETRFEVPVLFSSPIKERQLILAHQNQHNFMNNEDMNEIINENYEDPDFNIEMQDEVPPMVDFNLNLSPGNNFTSTSNHHLLNNFNYFPSPSTPKSYGPDFSTIQGTIHLNTSNLDDTQALLKQEIESNLIISLNYPSIREEKKINLTANSISSPRSAFRPCW